MKTKFSALNIANFYIALANSMPGDSIDNMKINKLLYYAQGFSMVILKKPLFYDCIEAWDYGPVIASVYGAFKCCGKNAIEQPTEAFDESLLSSDELNLLVDVYTNYGKYTGLALKEMTHEKGSPWDACYEPGKNHIIPLELMEKYFEKDKTFKPFQVCNHPENIITAIPVQWDGQGDHIYD